MQRSLWQSNFPIPPRSSGGGFLNPPRELRFGSGSGGVGGLLDLPLGRLEDGPVMHLRGRRQDSNMGSRDYGGQTIRILDSPRPPMKQGRSGNHNFRGGNTNNYDPPSLLDSNIGPPNHMLMNDFGLNDRDQGHQVDWRKSGGGVGAGASGNQNNQNNQRRKSNPGNNKPNSDSESKLTELETKAMDVEVSQAFYDRVQPLSLMQLATEVALEFARKEIHEKRGGHSTLLDQSFAAGNHSCTICRINFDIRMKVLNHYKSSTHKEVEDLFKLKKEQARLIMQKKITRPNTRPNAFMVAIVRAEVEMNLKPKEMELDPYILGVYESVMKPYWPSPKTTYYCRICNYKEFTTQADHSQHNISQEHKQREDTYESAFCLYCQVHTIDDEGKFAHDKTEDHIKIRNLMDKAKQCAIEHWHKVNDVETPEKYKKKQQQQHQPQQQQHQPQQQQQPDKTLVKTTNDTIGVGNKRRAPNPDQNSLKSPTKKLNVEPFPSNPVPIIKQSPYMNTSKPHQSSTRIGEQVQKSFVTKTIEPNLNILRNKNNETTIGKPKLTSPTKDSALAPKEKVWFIPVTGYMCAACHVFVEEKNQKAHVREISHTTSVIKFKRQMNS